MTHNLAQALPLVPNVLYSSRRRRTTRRGPAQGQTSLPDWVWGGGLGLIVLLFVAGYFLVGAASGGGGGGQCDGPQSPIRSSDISEEGFAAEDEQLTEMIEILESGDRTRFDTQFYQGDTHAFTHNVDKPLREADEDAAKALCEDVIFVEEGVSLRTPSNDLALALVRIQTLLRDAAGTLGYARPG